MNIKREKRLNSEFQREIYDILKYKVKNPDLTEMFSISEVDVTNDLKYAKVYVSVFSTDENKKKATFDEIRPRRTRQGYAYKNRSRTSLFKRRIERIRQ